MATDPYCIHDFGEYQVAILQGVTGLDIYDDNVDVEVRFPNGEQYGATFYTLRNIDSLMLRWAGTGECAHGLYFNAKHSIIVRELTAEKILSVVADLQQSGDLPKWFERLNADVANKALNQKEKKPTN